MRPQCVMLSLLTMLCAGCTSQSHDGLRPVYPELTRRTLLSQNGADIPRVDSLSPTFRWTGLSPDITYDFAIWDAIRSHRPRFAETSRLYYTPGVQIYYRKGLEETSHRPDIRLRPLKQYYWSVKVSGEDAWTTFTWRGGATLSNSLFLFETPFGTEE